MKWRWVLVGVALIATCVGPIVFLEVECGGPLFPPRPPSDQSFLDNFYPHRASFERLVKRDLISATPSVRRARRDPSKLPTDLDAEWDPKSYTEVLKDAGVFDGFAGLDGYDYLFCRYTTGIDGFDKGYAYLESPPRDIAERLDGGKVPVAGYESAYLFRPIVGHWYLYVCDVQ